MFTDELIKKLGYPYTTEYYSDIKKQNEFESVLVRRMNLEPVTERSQSDKYSILMHMYVI